MAMSTATIEENLQDIDAQLSIIMSAISSRLESDDALTLVLAEDVYFALRGVQRSLQRVQDHLPAVKQQ